MKKLLIFDKWTKQIVARHNFWDDSMTISDDWLLDSANQVAIVVEQNQKEQIRGEMIQPDGEGFKMVPVNEIVPELSHAQLEAQLEAQRQLDNKAL